MPETPLFKDLIVLELAAVLAGPSVGMFFAELGAKVIKVENFKRGGDVTRSWKLPGEDSESDLSAYFLSANWGKKSLALDLKKPEGRELIHQLIPKVDSVVVSYKPGDAEKLGMDYETLKSHNPKLIYTELTAYGPNDSRPGFDAIIQAEAGFTYMNGSPGGEPVKMPVALMDLLAAHQLKEGVLLALIRRMTTGKGSKVSTSLIEAGVASLANQASNFLNANHIPQRMGSSHPNIVPYGTIFYTRDKKPVVLAVGNDRQFSLLCEVLGHTELALDSRFKTNPDRVLNRDELNGLLKEAFLLVDRDPVLEELRGLKVPAGPVLDLAEVFAQPETQNLVLKKGGKRGVRTLAVAPFGPAPELPPHLGEHSREILVDFLGKDESEVENLRRGEIIYCG